MANEEHLEILGEGVDVWNEWRERNPEIKPDLRWVNFTRKNLAGANLARAHFVFAKLYGVNLTGANLSEAYLAGCGKTRFDADAVPRNSLVSTARPDKKKACAEKTSNSWTCSATSAPSSEFRTITPCALFVS